MTLLCHSERSEESGSTGTGFLPSVEMTSSLPFHPPCHSERSEESGATDTGFLPSVEMTDGMVEMTGSEVEMTTRNTRRVCSPVDNQRDGRDLPSRREAFLHTSPCWSGPMAANISGHVTLPRSMYLVCSGLTEGKQKSIILTRQQYISCSAFQAGAGSRRGTQGMARPLPSAATPSRRLPETPDLLKFIWQGRRVRARRRCWRSLL